jgi:iron complex outermembrane receptor protein
VIAGENANRSLLNELRAGGRFAQKHRASGRRAILHEGRSGFPPLMTTHLVSRSTRGFACSALAMSAAFFAAGGLMAQEPVLPLEGRGDDDDVVTLEKFVVAGSAVPVAAGRTFQPVTLLEGEEFLALGAANIAEGIRSVPAVFGNMNTEARANGGTGAAGVNLRGLGGTLTLLDGHRTAGFDEINLIPMIAFKRLEIVKDGAGARYGADALTGVFNIGMVPRFTGAEAQVFYGNTTDEDAGVVRAGVIAGGQRGKTDVVVAAEYYGRNALMARDREVSADADMRSQGGQNRRDNLVSSLIYGARPGDTAWGYLALAPGRSIGTVASDYVPFDTVANTSNQFLNTRHNTASIPEQENKSFYARINQQILPDGRLDAYARLLFAQNKYESFVLNTGIGLTGAVLATSPHAPTGLAIYPAPASTLAYVHPDAAGPRGRQYERDVYDFQFGLKGKLGEKWSWDATYVYGWWYRDDFQSNSINVPALRAAIASGAYNPFAMDYAAGVNPNNARAYDNPAALRAASASGRIDHDFGIRGGDARFNGELARLPGGALEIAGGGDYYIAEQSAVPDAVITTGSAVYSGFNSTQFSASGYTSKGAFAELVVPVFGGAMTLPLARSLSFSLNVRRSEKEIHGTVRNATNAITVRERTFKETTPKFGMLYQPVRDLRVRATYAEGFRTPGLSFLFAAPSTFTTALGDPLGFPIANVTPVTGRGNPDLEPERSKTWNTGVVFTPQAVPGLQLEIDYYTSRIEGLIADGAQLILNVNAAAQGPGFVPGNAATINPNATFADRITRNAGGSVIGVSSTPMNVASREATGLDYAITYTWPRLAGARWVSRLGANTTLSWDLVSEEGSPARSWLGRFVDVGVNSISPGSIPRHRGFLSQSWEKGAWAAFARVNHVSHLEDDTTRTYLRTFRYISSWTTLDGNVEYRFKADAAAWLSKVKIRVGVTNLLDEEAPFAAGAFNDGHDMTTHSNRGRFVYAQVTKAF